MPSTFGSDTAKSIINLPPRSPHVEAISVADLKQGTPVKMNSSAQWVALAAGDVETNRMGIAMHDVLAGQSLTVALKGIAVINALSSAATVPGPVEYVDYTTRPRYVTSSGVTKTVGFAIDAAGGANVPIRVMV